jgi:hypothetical protein
MMKMTDTLEKVVEKIKVSKKTIDKAISEMEKEVIYAFKSYDSVVEHVTHYKYHDGKTGIDISFEKDEGYKMEFSYFMAPVTMTYTKYVSMTGAMHSAVLHYCREEMTKMPYYEALKLLRDDLVKEISKESKKVAAEAASLEYKK